MADEQQDVVDLLRQFRASVVEDGVEIECAPQIESYMKAQARMNGQPEAVNDRTWRIETTLAYMLGVYGVNDTMEILGQVGYFGTQHSYVYCASLNRWLNPLTQLEQERLELQLAHGQRRTPVRVVLQTSQQQTNPGVNPVENQNQPPPATNSTTVALQTPQQQTNPGVNHLENENQPSPATNSTTTQDATALAAPQPTTAPVHPANITNVQALAIPDETAASNNASATTDKPAENAVASVLLAQPSLTSNNESMPPPPNQTPTKSTLPALALQAQPSPGLGSSATTQPGRPIDTMAQQESVLIQNARNALAAAGMSVYPVVTTDGLITNNGSDVILGPSHPYRSPSQLRGIGPQRRVRIHVPPSQQNPPPQGLNNVPQGQQQPPSQQLNNAFQVTDFSAANPGSFAAGLAYGASDSTGTLPSSEIVPQAPTTQPSVPPTMEPTSIPAAASVPSKGRATLPSSEIGHTENGTSSQPTSTQQPVPPTTKPNATRAAELVDEQMHDDDAETEIEDGDEQNDDEISIPSEKNAGKKRFTPAMYRSGVQFDPSKHYKGNFSVGLQRQRKKWIPECYEKSPYTYEMRHPPEANMYAIKYKPDRHLPIEQFQMTIEDIEEDGMVFDADFHLLVEYTEEDSNEGIDYHPWIHYMPEYDEKVHGSLVAYKNYMVKLNKLDPEQFEKYQANDSRIEGLGEDGWPEEEAYETRLGFMHLTEETSIDFAGMKPQKFRQLSTNMVLSQLEGCIRSQSGLKRAETTLVRFLDACGIDKDVDLMERIKIARSGKHFSKLDPGVYQDALGFVLCDWAEDTIRRGLAATTAVEEMMKAAGKPKDTSLESLYVAKGQGIGRSLPRLGDAFNLVEPISVRRAAFAKGIQYNMEENERLRIKYKGKDHLYLRIDDDLRTRSQLYQNTIAACDLEESEAEPDSPPPKKAKAKPKGTTAKKDKSPAAATPTKARQNPPRAAAAKVHSRKRRASTTKGGSGKKTKKR